MYSFRGNYNLRDCKMERHIRHCNYCNNNSPFEIVFETTTDMLWEDGTYWAKSTEDNQDWERGWLTHYEPFFYCIVKCFSCGHISVLGDYEVVVTEKREMLPQLFPITPDLPDMVPENIRESYREAAMIRVRAPHAYVGQIRRSLEILCQENSASGKTLVQKLQSLSKAGLFPNTLSEMTDLIRQIGNIGVHAENRRVSIFDTELIDGFFRAIIEYVYIAPSKISELKRRMEHDRHPPDNDEDIPF